MTNIPIKCVARKTVEYWKYLKSYKELIYSLGKCTLFIFYDLYGMVFCKLISLASVDYNHIPH